MNALMTRSPDRLLSNFMDDFFNDNLWSNRKIAAWSPSVDIVELENAYKLQAEIPGMDKKDIKIDVDKGVLTVSGERTAEKKEEKKGTYQYFERQYGSFTRSFKLPEHVNASKIKATYKDGVLELEIPKTEASKALQVNID